MPQKHTFSLRYVLVLLAIVSLCLVAYSECRIYSIAGSAFTLAVSLAFVRRLKTLVVVGIVAFSLIWIVTIADVLWHGPVTKNHNERLADIARSNQLVGKSKQFAVSLLGEPTSTYDNPNGVTLNYAPFRNFPGGKFQVHCEYGAVYSIELYDD